MTTWKLTFENPSDGFAYPSAIAVGTEGEVWVVDPSKQSLCVIAKDAQRSVRCPIGQADTQRGFADGAGAAVRIRAQAGLLALADGSILFADTGNNRLRKVRCTGRGGVGCSVTTVAGSGRVGLSLGVAALADLPVPSGLAPLSYGRIVVSDPYHNVLRVVTP